VGLGVITQVAKRELVDKWCQIASPILRIWKLKSANIIGQGIRVIFRTMGAVGWKMLLANGHNDKPLSIRGGLAKSPSDRCGFCNPSPPAPLPGGEGEFISSFLYSVVVIL